MLVLRGEEQIRFEISDTGIGMTEQQVQYLFKSFHQADASVSRQFGGSGLGLTISQRLAGVLGGSNGRRRRLARKKSSTRVQPKGRKENP